MLSGFKGMQAAVFPFLILLTTVPVFAQSSATAGTIDGKVTDPTGAVVPGAQVKIHNPVSGFSQTAASDGAGQFHFRNVPFNPYHLSVAASGFASYALGVKVGRRCG